AFGVDHVRSFGRAFTVQVDAADWSWMRRYGWRYEARCGDRAEVGQIPFLSVRVVGFPNLECASTENAWRGRWAGPPSKLRLYSRGKASIDVDGERVWQGEGWDIAGEADVHTGSIIEVRVQAPANVPLLAALERLTPAGEQAPFLEW